MRSMIFREGFNVSQSSQYKYNKTHYFYGDVTVRSTIYKTNTHDVCYIINTEESITFLIVHKVRRDNTIGLYGRFSNHYGSLLYN